MVSVMGIIGIINKAIRPTSTRSMNRNLPPVLRRLIYFSLTLSFVSLGLSSLLFLERDQIVYVDTMKLLSQYRGTTQAKAAYDKKVAVWKANVDILTIELNKQITQYERDKKGLSGHERKLTEEGIASKQQQLENYKTTISENTAKEDQVIATQVVKEINDFLNKYGEDHGYDYILGATNVGNVVYARRGKNITDEVLTALNGGSQPSKK
jgi:outer membrane protein